MSETLSASFVESFIFWPNSTKFPTKAADEDAKLVLLGQALNSALPWTKQETKCEMQGKLRGDSVVWPFGVSAQALLEFGGEGIDGKRLLQETG